MLKTVGWVDAPRVLMAGLVKMMEVEADLGVAEVVAAVVGQFEALT